MHSSGQGALIKTHCLYSLQEASSRPRCSPDVHPRHPPPRNSIPRGSLFGQLPSKSFETILRPRFFAILSLSLHLLPPGDSLFSRENVSGKRGRGEEIVCTVLVDCLARKQRNRAIPNCRETVSLERERRGRRNFETMGYLARSCNKM